MMPTRKRVAVLGVIAISALCGPLASAAVAVAGPVPFEPGGCSDPAVVAPGATGGTEMRICQGSGLVFSGPQGGQIRTVIRPPIISPGFVGNAVSSAGSVVVAP